MGGMSGRGESGRRRGVVRIRKGEVCFAELVGSGGRKEEKERVEREEGGHGVQIEESRKDEIRQEVQVD